MPQIISIIPEVVPELSLLFPQVDASYELPPPAPPAAPAAPYDDGGIALGLDPLDDLEPRWLFWCAWVDAP